MTLLKVQLKLQGLLRKTLKNKNVWSDWKKLIILLLPIFPGLWGFFWVVVVVMVELDPDGTTLY